MKSNIAIAWLLAICSGYACADSLSDYRSGSTNKQINEINSVYIIGVAKGYEWANVVLTTSNRLPLFCQPDKLLLNRHNYEAMVKRESTRREYPENTPIEIILINALVATFPCQK